MVHTGWISLLSFPKLDTDCHYLCGSIWFFLFLFCYSFAKTELRKSISLIDFLFYRSWSAFISYNPWTKEGPWNELMLRELDAQAPLRLQTSAQDNLGEYVMNQSPFTLCLPLQRITLFQLSRETGKNFDRNKQCGSTVMSLEIKSELREFCATSRCRQYCGVSLVAQWLRIRLPT